MMKTYAVYAWKGNFVIQIDVVYNEQEAKDLAEKVGGCYFLWDTTH